MSWNFQPRNANQRSSRPAKIIMTAEGPACPTLEGPGGTFQPAPFTLSSGPEPLTRAGGTPAAKAPAAAARLWLRYGIATSEGGAVGVAFRAARDNDLAI